MGERKGVNKYYPPDYDPNKGGLNKFLGTHALRERARKLHLGILIIRFEMPYNIWCEGCNNHIGTGVRYNAEKKKVGMYYSTPIYQFRMKCHLCDNYFEIKTDPANLDYEIVSGARRQERRWDPTENEQVVPEDKDVSRKMASDAMYKLEHGVQDKAKSTEIDPTIERLEEFQSSRWHDDYNTNKRLRSIMRGKRVEAKAQAAKDASYNLPVPLLPPTEEDMKMARLLQFTQSKSSERLREEKRMIIDAQSVFAKLKPKKIPQKAKKAFARQSLQDIVTHSHKNFSSFTNTLRPQALGVVHKKSSIHETPERTTLIKNMSNKLNTSDATFSISSEDEKSVRSDTTAGDDSLSIKSDDFSDIDNSLNTSESYSSEKDESNISDQPVFSQNDLNSEVNSNFQKDININMSTSLHPLPGPSNETVCLYFGSQVSQTVAVTSGNKERQVSGLVNYDLSGSDSDDLMQ